MLLRSTVKKAIPPQWRPFAISTYLKGHALYFSCYRRLLRPSRKYLAVAEQNYITGAPPEWTCSTAWANSPGCMFLSK